MYYLFLYNLFRRLQTNTQPIESYPFFTIVMPIYNERGYIEKKLKNFLEMEYARDRFRVIIVDADSTDGSIEIIQNFMKNFPECQLTLMNSPQRGRSYQLNSALRSITATDIVLFTDTDALLAPDALIWIVREFSKDPRIGVVGAYVEPVQAIPLELKYWNYQNIMRWLESNISSSSIVVGPCYAFLPRIMSAIPEDCSADDVFACFQANALGYTSKYPFEAKAFEFRTPSTVWEYLNHKFRKGNGYIVELLRFLYLFPTYQTKWKIVYLTKFLQVIIMPFLLIWFGLISANLSLISLSHFFGVLGVWLFLLINVAITSRLLRDFFERRYQRTISGGLIESFLYNNFVLFFSVISYFFYFQDSRPVKINHNNMMAIPRSDDE
jgi:cellulose synthase/poly-beta-1,6-N-acetylglucosamine synthase-like glycosyltransferase